MPPPSPILPPIHPPPSPPAVAWPLHSQHADIAPQQLLGPARAQSAQLRSLHARALLHMHAPFCNSTISPAPHQSAHDYPVFNPSFGEFELGNSIPEDSSRRSVDSREALRHADVTPFQLDQHAEEVHFHANAFSAAQGVSTVHYICDGGKLPCEQTASHDTGSTHSRPAAAPSHVRASGRRGSRAHHITSIHPTRGSAVQKSKPRMKIVEELSDWNLSRDLINKKPLSEFLNDIARENQQSNKHPSAADAHVAQDTIPSMTQKTNAPDVTPEHADLGCLFCDKCLPGSKVTVVPLMDSRDYTDIPPKDRDFSGSVSKGRISSNPFSWFCRFKKKPSSPTDQMVSKDTMAKSLTDPKTSGAPTTMHAQTISKANVIAEEKRESEIAMALNSMELEVSQANKKRDAALAEVFELKQAIEEMAKKLEHLEHYCQNLRHASAVKLGESSSSGEEVVSLDGEEAAGSRRRVGEMDRLVATRKEFYHAVTQARVGVKQFCRILLQLIQGVTSPTLAAEKLEAIVEPLNLQQDRVATHGWRKRVLYYLESVISEAMYEDFENIKFKRNGSHCVLDARQRVQAFYKTYSSISQLTWSELLSKESGAYSESFDSFCDAKMNRLQEVIKWEGRWPDELANAFFVAARWLWLLHLLAFSFEPIPTIFRVGSEAHFDPHFMEQIRVEMHHHQQNETVDDHQIMAMVMPGFFLPSNEVIKCKVILSKQ